jgi:hypothetical protein
MKKFPLLLLDAGPIIKLFELNIWEDFLEKCDVTISRTVAEEVIYIDNDGDKQYIPYGLKPWEENGLIKIVDVPLSDFNKFNKLARKSRYIIDPGELETLAFLHNSSDEWTLCAADNAAFSFLGFLNRGKQGISLEEILKKIGLPQPKYNKEYSKKFRLSCTKQGEIDAIQNG